MEWLRRRMSITLVNELYREVLWRTKRLLWFGRSRGTCYGRVLSFGGGSVSMRFADVSRGLRKRFHITKTGGHVTVGRAFFHFFQIQMGNKMGSRETALVALRAPGEASLGRGRPFMAPVYHS